MYFFVLICGLSEIACGQRLWSIMSSTVIARLFCMSIIAALCAGLVNNVFLFPIMLSGLMFWRSFGWDNYWSAAIGNSTDKNARCFPPVDFIMQKLFSKLSLRAWGTLAMGLRGLICIYPLFATLGILGYNDAYWLGLFFIFQGVPYCLCGFKSNRQAVIPDAQFLWGFWGLGLTLYYSLTGVL